MSSSVDAAPKRAAQERRYLKSELEFLGVTMPALRREAKAFVRAQPELDVATLRALGRELWGPIHDLRSVAVAVLELEQAKLEPRDVARLIGWVRETFGVDRLETIFRQKIGQLFQDHAHPGINW